ncbi:MAG: SAM-dependent methyltransferase [Cyanobacteria bacterium J06623_5]
MAMQLAQVVPFGRSLDEYIQMFSLSAADLRQPILSAADGPASFNAEATVKGYQIQSCDPLYAFGADDIRDRFYAVRDNIIDQVRQSPDDWVWTYHNSPDDLGERRSQVTECFAADFEQGKQQGRYTMAELPQLPYADNAYKLGLCSHFLFLYSDQLGLAFHLAAIGELLRICSEVRIFPLLSLSLARSPHLAAVTQHLTASGHSWKIETVKYELQRGGNEMLRIIRAA